MDNSQYLKLEKHLYVNEPIYGYIIKCGYIKSKKNSVSQRDILYSWIESYKLIKISVFLKISK